jgi:SAM-dependent methyltransferase
MRACVKVTALDTGTSAPAVERCDVCGSAAFEHRSILWPSLISEWGLTPDEARYIDIQQGTCCVACGANVRSMALARAIMRFRDFGGQLADFVEDPRQSALRVLEINEAGTLHPLLRKLPQHQFVSYPAFDMMDSTLPSKSFDLVVHSDTLEHVTDPLAGLRECRRLIDDHGAAIFTVPTVIARLSRSRVGWPPSYHGEAGSLDPGMRVHTEFGADVWTFVARAGFGSCELLPWRFPSGLAIIARS